MIEYLEKMMSIKHKIEEADLENIKLTVVLALHFQMHLIFVL